jgi:hypothetical protein
MPSLFDIGTELQALDQLLDERGGDISDTDVEAAVTQWFEQLAHDESRKLDNYYGLIRQLEGEAEVAKSEANTFRQKAQTRERRIAWLKSLLLTHLQRTNRTKVSTATGRTIALQANGGKLPLAVNWDLIDLDEIDPKFVTIKRELNQDAVRAALESGEEFIYAMIQERGQHLRIK